VEPAGVQELEDSGEGIVGRDAVGQFQEGLQPGFLGPSIGLDLNVGLAAGDDAAEDDEDIDESVLPVGGCSGGRTDRGSLSGSRTVLARPGGERVTAGRVRALPAGSAPLWAVRARWSSPRTVKKSNRPVYRPDRRAGSSRGGP
jgi:hypothetical protein